MMPSAHIVVPDVRLPVIDHVSARKPAGNGVRHTNQLRRRAQVLAAARRRLGEVGHDRLNLRIIAQDCGVSVQTIFNLVGNRSDVICHSVADLGSLIDQLARAAEGYPNYIMAFADIIWQFAVHNDESMRQLALANGMLDPKSGVVRRRAMLLISDALRSPGMNLRRGVSLPNVADLLAANFGFSMYAWASDRSTLEACRENLIGRTGLIMLGALDRESGHDIERYLSLS